MDLQWSGRFDKVDQECTVIEHDEHGETFFIVFNDGQDAATVTAT
jgi:hypothetical protein